MLELLDFAALIKQQSATMLHTGNCNSHNSKAYCQVAAMIDLGMAVQVAHVLQPLCHTCSRNPNAPCTMVTNDAGDGPSSTDPNAKVAASRFRQSSGVAVVLMLACTNDMTKGTKASLATRAMRPRHVPAAIARFHMVSSCSCPSSCLVSCSSRTGARWGETALMK